MKKKGISPLIATVLLIAFAVALGALVMTYSGSLSECGKIDIEISEVGGSPQICYNSEEKLVVVTITNGVKENINKFVFNLYGSRDVDNVEILQTIEKAQTKKLTIPYDLERLGALEKVEIKPVQLNGDDEIVCPVNTHVIAENIPLCS